MIKRGVTSCDTVSSELNRLHDTYGLSWRKIAVLDDYRGIPPGTLSSIAKGKPVPHKWLHQLGLPETKPAPVCRYCGVVHVSQRCPRRRQHRDLFDMPVKTLLWKLNNREAA